MQNLKTIKTNAGMLKSHFGVGLLVLLLSLNSDSSLAQDCGNPKDDRYYMYKNGSKIDIEIITMPDGKETFRAVRKSDGKVLREYFNDEFEHFFNDLSDDDDFDPEGFLKIEYDIIEQCGGVDIQYKVHNPTGLPQRLPFFQIKGIMLDPAGNLYTLLNSYGYLIRRDTTDENFAGNPFPFYHIGQYGSYSPVIAAHDSSFAVGSALQYPILDYKHVVTMNIYREPGGIRKNSWRYVYEGMEDERKSYDTTNVDSDLAFIEAGETRYYTVSIRFSDPRYWLLTLYPYKKYFNILYGGGASITPKDIRPISNCSLHLADFQPTPRGYRFGIDSLGLSEAIPTAIKELKQNGYQRAMIWAFSGMHKAVKKDGKEYPWAVNYPPQFMSDLLPAVEATLDSLKLFAENGISLGFWWGRAGRIPVPLQWDPDTLRVPNLNNPEDVAFFENELMLAVERGAKDIGLDDFGGISPTERMRWIDMVETLAPHIKFIAEGGGGATSDFIHSKVAIWYSPYNWIRGQYPEHLLQGPSLLSNYLNPGAEIQVQTNYTDPPAHTFDYVQNLVRWGYTPVIQDYGMCIDVTNLDTSIVECFDGIDNDNDGLTDFPYDPACACEKANSEQIVQTDSCKQAYPTTEVAGSSRLSIEGFELLQNYPNPFNPETTIRYSVAKPSHVQIKIYNQHGQLVFTLVDEKKPAGEYQIIWDGKNNQNQQVASGVYFYQMVTSQHVYTKKLLLLR